MKAFREDADFVRKRITSAQGWVMLNWARDNEDTLFGSKPSGTRYVAQELKKQLKKAKTQHGKRR